MQFQCVLLYGFSCAQTGQRPGGADAYRGSVHPKCTLRIKISVWSKIKTHIMLHKNRSAECISQVQP